MVTTLLGYRISRFLGMILGLEMELLSYLYFPSACLVQRDHSGYTAGMTSPCMVPLQGNHSIFADPVRSSASVTASIPNGLSTVVVPNHTASQRRLPAEMHPRSNMGCRSSHRDQPCVLNQGRSGLDSAFLFDCEWSYAWNAQHLGLAAMVADGLHRRTKRSKVSRHQEFP